MGHKQKIIATICWAVVVTGMLAFVANGTMRGHPDEKHETTASRFEPLYDVPSFELTDQNGKHASNKDLLGSVWIADFIFTNCAGPCPLMSSKLADVQKKLSRPDVKLVSFSVDPERDTPAVLKEYARHYAADESRWSFVTGTSEQLAAVAKGMNVASQKEQDQSVTHSTQFLLVDRAGHVCGIYRMNDDDVVSRLVADASALAESTRQ